jgi:hypothetical protein
MANINSMSPRTGRIIKEDNTIVNEADGINADGSRNVRIKEVLVEAQTNADAVAGVLTFSANISLIEILNTDSVNTGVFAVNGLNITIPPSELFYGYVGGTPGATVTVTGATTYIVNRYE